jgi:hypothetical protein
VAREICYLVACGLATLLTGVGTQIAARAGAHIRALPRASKGLCLFNKFPSNHPG